MAKSRTTTKKLYSPYEISKMTDADINKAYSELRSIANKRLQRQQAAGIGLRAMTGYRFAKISEIQDSSKWTVASQLADVSAFLRSERTTVSGERAFLNSYKEQLTDMGYGSLVQSTEDIYKVVEYLNVKREEYSDQLYDSGDVLDTLEQAQRLKIPEDVLRKNFDMFMEHVRDMEKLPKTRGKMISENKLNRMIRKFRK